MHNTWNHEADGQQEKITQGATSISQEQETETSLHMSFTLVNRRLENVAWADESQFLLQHSDGRGTNYTKLEYRFKEEWQNISKSRCANLTDS